MSESNHKTNMIGHFIETNPLHLGPRIDSPCYPYFCPDIVICFSRLGAPGRGPDVGRSHGQLWATRYSSEFQHRWVAWLRAMCFGHFWSAISLGFFIEVNGIFSRFFQCQLTNHWRVSYSYWAGSSCVSSLGVKAILETGCQCLWLSFCRVHNGWLMDYPLVN